MIFALFILSAAATTSLGATNCRGDINKLNPRGKANGGVAASQADVRAHLNTLNSMKSIYERVANKYCVPASVIAGIASRESNGGDSLASDGTGDGGKAWGIMQCDMSTSGLNCKSCPAKSECHIDMMVLRVLIPYFNEVTKKFPSWTPEQRMQGAIAAYNFGVRNVQSWAGLDVGTTHNDYSNDVIARAQYLRSLGWSYFPLRTC